MHLILSLIISTTLQAKVVQVNYKNFNYKVDYNETRVIYTAPQTELSFKEKLCNKHIIKEFKSKMDAHLRGDFLTKQSEQTYTLVIDDSKKFDLFTSKRGLFFAKFDEYFKTLKVEETLNCN